MNKFQILKDKLKEAKANFDCFPCPAEIKVEIEAVCESDLNDLKEELDSLRRQLYALSDELWSHKYDGHIPKINGAEKMAKVLEVLELNKDYEVEPRTIYASDTGKAKKYILEISKKE